jgi:hypothetical protein
MYHYINDEDYTEVVMSSTDKGLLQEIMCDDFMWDVLCEFNSQTYYLATFNRSLEDIATQSWNWIIDYYNDYVDIMSSEVI